MDKWLVKQAIAILVPVFGRWSAPFLTLEAKKAICAFAKAQVGKTDTPFDDDAVAALAASWGV